MLSFGFSPRLQVSLSLLGTQKPVHYILNTFKFYYLQVWSTFCCIVYTIDCIRLFLFLVSNSYIWCYFTLNQFASARNPRPTRGCPNRFSFSFRVTPFVFSDCFLAAHGNGSSTFLFPTNSCSSAIVPIFWFDVELSLRRRRFCASSFAFLSCPAVSLPLPKLSGFDRKTKILLSEFIPWIQFRF
jgi:hypothetical protein